MAGKARNGTAPAGQSAIVKTVAEFTHRVVRWAKFQTHEDTEREAKALGEVRDADTYARGAVLVGKLRDWRLSVEEYYKPLKRAIDSHKDDVLAMERADVETPAALLEDIEGSMEAWRSAEEARAADEQAELQRLADEKAEAERKATLQRLQEAQARERDKAAADAIKREAEALQRAPVVSTKVEVKPAVPSTTGSGYRKRSERWTADVESLEDLILAVAEGIKDPTKKAPPVRALCANTQFLNAQANQLHEAMDYPGVKARKV